MRKRCLILTFLLACPWPVCASQAVHSLLVFPFENLSSRADLNWIAESFAQVLSSRLPQADNYILDREERNAAYAQLDIPADAPLTLASEFKVAQTLGVDWAVLGDFQVTGNDLVAHAQLLDVKQLKLSPPMEVAGDLPELVDLQTRLAWRLLAVHDSGFTVGNEEQFRARFHDIRLDAFENYIRGLVATDDTSRLHFLAEAARLDPTDHRAAFALGRFYFSQKDYANSAKWLAKIEAADADYNESLFLRAVDEFFLGREQVAEREFQALERVLPLDEVSNNLGVLEFRRGRYTEAGEHFERAYQSNPSDADFCFNRGVVLWYEKHYAESAESLEAAVALDSEDAEAHTLLSLAYGKLGKVDAQRGESDWLAEHDEEATTGDGADVLPQPRLKKRYDGRAFRLLELTLHNAVEERLASASTQQHIDAHLAQGKHFLAQHRGEEAEQELREVVSLAPDDPQAHALLAEALEDQNKHSEAVEEWKACLRFRETASGHLSLARVYMAMNQPQLAHGEIDAAIRLEPNNPQAQQLLLQLPAEPPAARTTP